MSSTFTDAVKFALSSTPSRLTVVKPGSANVTEYVPGRRSMILYWPCESVNDVRVFSMRIGLVASTVTPGRTAPELSFTTPAMTLWADAPAGSARQTTATSGDQNVRRIPLPPELLSVLLQPLQCFAGERIVRIELQRSAELAVGLIQPPQRQQHVPKVVVRGRGIGLQSKRLRELPRGALEVAGFDEQQREIVVKRRVVGVGLEHRAVAADVLWQQLRAQAPGQRRQVGGIARQDLHPEIPHLVGGALPESHSNGWCVRVGRIAIGIVVGVLHRQAGAIPENQPPLLSIRGPPGGVPAGGGDQPPRRGRSQRRPTPCVPCSAIGLRVGTGPV